MSKSIKQIADEIGVSKQAVFKKIKREPLSTSLKQFISTVDGAVNDNQSSTINQTNDYKTSQDIENIITVLENTIETLKNQLEIKDAQLEKLTDALVAAQQTAAAAQALHAGTIQQQITTTQDTQEKKSWLKKLFG